MHVLFSYRCVCVLWHTDSGKTFSYTGKEITKRISNPSRESKGEDPNFGFIPKHFAGESQENQLLCCVTMYVPPHGAIDWPLPDHVSILILALSGPC